MLVLSLRASSACLLLFSFLAAGCNRSDEQIKVYRLIKPSSESTPPDKDSLASTNAPVKSTLERVPSASSNVATPPNWEPQQLSEMRQASFLVRGANGATADISFVKLGPSAGNVLENVNRWLGQLAQPPISPDKLATMIQKVSTPRGEVDVVDLSGKPESGDEKTDGRIVAGIASDEGTSFYKMRGNRALVGEQKENFLKWVRSMRSDTGDQTMTQSGAPMSAPSGKPQIKWEVPAGWSPNPASAIRYASFAAGDGSGGKVDISVITFPGDGGDDLSNINRWRQQIGLAPIDMNAANITPLKSGETVFATIDIAGANARTLAAWTRRDGHAWFFKLTGPSPTVEKEKVNFGKFVQSVRF
jgi:hypothetical protein